jgi:hypothetical protein
MPYTHKSLALAWLSIFALYAVSASGVAQGRWFVLLLAVGIAVPALLLKSPVPARASPERVPSVDEKRGGSPVDGNGIDVFGWENEGGAGRMHVREWPREPARADS